MENEKTTTSTQDTKEAQSTQQETERAKYREPFVDWDRKAKEEAQQLADTVTNWLNCSSHNIQHFFTAMDREHRYLQGEFANLCVEYLLHCAKPEYRYDPRNSQAAVFGRLMEYAIEHSTEINPDRSDYSKN